MDQATKQNAAMIEKMAAACNLKSQAQELAGNVAVFKLASEEGGSAPPSKP